MAFEDILSQIENKGRFQILQIFSLAIPLIIMSCHFLLENFTAFVPNHRCRIPFLDNTSTLLNVSENLNFSSLLKLSIPLDSNGKLERCLRFSWTQRQNLSPNVTRQTQSLLEKEPCVDGWVYDQSFITSSIVTEWDLVCDSQSLKSLSASIFLSGILVGYLIWGYLIDRFGRKRILTPSFLMVAVFSIGPAFAQTFPVYCCLRFLLGFSISGAMFSSGALVIEWITIKHRLLVGVIIGLCLSVGHILTGVLAYGIQEWRKFQLIVSAPFLTFFLTIWWLPESARWLIVQKKYDDALKVLRKVAKFNGVKDLNLTVETLRSTTEKELISTKTHYNMLDLFRFPVLKTRILCSSFEGFTTAMLFYGLSLDLQNLGSNIQMLQILLGASTFLSRFVALFILNYFGRQTIMVACLFLGGLSIFASAFLPQGILRVLLTILGISCGMVCSSCKIVYFAEFLPTVVRNMSRGFILTIDRIGAILAPLVNILKYYIPVLPQIIFGIMTITASLVVFFFLPETQNQPMPDTIQDIEHGFGRKRIMPPSFLMVAVSSTGPAFAQTFPVYCCLRFLLGFSISGTIFSSGTLALEWTTIQHRPLVGVIIGLCFSVGHLFTGVLAYGIQEWCKFQLVVSAPFLTFFLTICFTTAMLCYGLSLDLQNLGSNIQMLQILLGASTFMSRFVALFILNYFGRHTIMVACLLFGGLSVFASAFLPQGILRIVLTILGINCGMVCNSCKTVYSAELLPTVVRNMSNGFILTIDRIGAILAPVVNILKYYIPVLPQIIFGIMAITASLVIFFFLPETQNQPMPDTIQDIEHGSSKGETRPRDEGDTTVKISQF